MKYFYKLSLMFVLFSCISCGLVSEATWLVRLNVSGVTGETVIRLTHGSKTEDLTFTEDAVQTFPGLTDGERYTLSVVSAPEDVECLLGKTSGSIEIQYENQRGLLINYEELEETIPVYCSAEKVDVSVSVFGLHSGDQFGVNFIDSFESKEVVEENGVQTFTTQLPQGAQYNITIVEQPRTQICSVENGQGEALENVDDVVIKCDYVNKIFSASYHKGNLGGRSGANEICGAVTNANLCGEAVAFLSVDSDDEIRDFPSHYNLNTDLPVYAEVTEAYGSTVRMASDWAELLDGDGIDNEVYFPNGVSSLYWTGSSTNGDGSVNTNACSAWTSSSKSVSGEVGAGIINTTDDWLGFSGYRNGLECDRSMGVLCLCVMDKVAVGGTVTGLADDQQVTLNLNSGEQTLPVLSDGSYQFWLDQGATYDVVVSSQPSGQNCTVANEMGTATSTVSDVNVTCESATQSELYLFPSEEVHSANLGGRLGADEICQNTYGSNFSHLVCANGVSAFLSVDTDDEIQDMPELYGIDTELTILNADNGDAVVAGNWADLLDGEIQSSFDFDWWSGSLPDGSIGEFGNCSGWTSTDPDLAIGGDAGMTDTFWIELSDFTCDVSELNVMCLCY